MLGEKIKRLRKEKSMTQKKLAKKVGISTSYLQQLELGQKDNPSVDVLFAISDVLDVQADYLLGRSEYKNPDSELMKSDILNLIELTDDKNYDFARLVRNIVDTCFLTIHDYAKSQNVEALQVIHDLYRNIWNTKITAKNEKFYSTLSLDELKDYDGYEYEYLKKENIVLLDKLYNLISNRENNK